ncbi:GTP pyrophosphokinase [Symbiobacterium thermophilum]|nr:RelA/SpoT domain-containing protein [Symbiobacterium thermophilum]
MHIGCANEVMQLMNGKQREWVETFRSQQALYQAFGQCVQQLLSHLLDEANIPINGITYRVKSVDALAEKLTRPGKDYESLIEVTDLVGVRVVTNFADDVDRVVRVIDRHFEVDLDHSEDKRPHDPHWFGYSSVHRVCLLPPAVLARPEYARFAGLRCEIQVRSILQHAWAEIEHDLGYKVAGGIPSSLRRRFSMLAGLLELADDQFMRLRDELSLYSTRVVAQMHDHPESVALDPISLETFIRRSDLVQALDEEISEMRGRPLMGPTKAVLEARVEELEHLGITNLKDLADALEQSQERVRSLARQIYRDDRRRGLPMSRGSCLSLLVQVLIGRRESLDEIRALLDRFNIGAPAARDERALLLRSMAQGLPAKR